MHNYTFAIFFFFFCANLDLGFKCLSEVFRCFFFYNKLPKGLSYVAIAANDTDDGRVSYSNVPHVPILRLLYQDPTYVPHKPHIALDNFFVLVQCKQTTEMLN